MLTTAEPEPHPEQLPEEGRPVDPGSPPYLVPEPARLAQPLFEHDVVLHDPSTPATRYDLLAVTEVDAHNRVGIADAPTYHAAVRRNQLDELACTATRVDIDNLWVERVHAEWDDIPIERHPPEVHRPSPVPADVMLEHPIQPPIRELGRLRGRLAGSRAMVAWRLHDGALVIGQWQRVISAPHLSDDGEPNLVGDLDDLNQPNYQQSVVLCDEPDYFAWADTGITPSSIHIEPLCYVLID